MTTEEKTDKRAALLASVDQTIEELAGAVSAFDLTEKINAYAALQAKFYRYSLNNLLLMQHQLAKRGKELMQPAGFRAWLKLNRVPRKGSGLAILAPARYKEKDEDTGEEWYRVRGFKVVHVFDVQDTDVLPGKDDLYVPPGAGLSWEGVDGDYGALLVRLLDAARAHKIRVEIGPGPEGRRGSSDGEGHIWLNAGLSSGERCGTLLHELAHELCHDRARRKGYGGEKNLHAVLECEAEAIAHCLAGHLGVPRPNVAQYVALHGATPAILRRSLEAIRDGVATVLDALQSEDEDEDERRESA